jgi:hypothetical protein
MFFKAGRCYAETMMSVADVVPLLLHTRGGVCFPTGSVLGSVLEASQIFQRSTKERSYPVKEELNLG